MIIRALDSNKDWEFGKGKNNYKKDRDAIAQDINSRLYSFLGDCFFDTSAGIDWFNLLGSKNQLQLNLAISATITNTAGVTGILQISSNINLNRNFTVIYKVQSIYGVVDNTFQYDLNGLG